MRKRLSYADAVALLGGASPAVAALDRLLGGALTLASAAGAGGALSLFDAKAEIVRLSQALMVDLTERVRGFGRFERSERLRAANAVLVVTAFFQAFDGLDVPLRLEDVALSFGEQVRLADGTSADGHWVDRVLRAEVPAPSSPT